MLLPRLLTFALFSLSHLAASEPVSNELEARQSVPECTDGGTLYCCQATFSGAPGPIVAASALTCYDLTPEVVNCIITDAPSLPGSGCVGTYSCCQVTNLAPVIGLFCSKPPGDCVGGRENCTNILKIPGCENA